MSLKKAGIRKEASKRGKYSAIAFIGMLSVLIIISTIAVGVGAYVALANKSEPAEPPAVDVSTTITPTTSTITITTTSAPPTTSSTTTTSTSSTTTTLCSGKFQEPCLGTGCNLGFIIGSTGLCHPLGCAPSTSSGRGGCGAFALNYCQD